MTHHTNNKLIQYDCKRCRRLHTKHGETRFVNTVAVETAVYVNMTSRETLKLVLCCNK